MVEIKSPAPDTANFFDWLQFVEFVMGFRPLFDIVNGLAKRQNIATDRFRHIQQCSITLLERDFRKKQSPPIRGLRNAQDESGSFFIQYLMLSLTKHEPVEA